MHPKSRQQIKQEIRQLLQSSTEPDLQRSSLLLHSFYLAAILGLFLIGVHLGSKNAPQTLTDGQSTDPYADGNTTEPVYYLDGHSMPSTAITTSENLPEIEVILL